MNEAYIIDGVRTPIGRFKGSLSTIRTDDLAALVITELVEKHPEIPPSDYEDLFFGCTNQAGEDNRNVARMASLLAGVAWSVPGETINRLCASGMSAIDHARKAILANEGSVYLAGGLVNFWVPSINFKSRS